MVAVELMAYIICGHEGAHTFELILSSYLHQGAMGEKGSKGDEVCTYDLFYKILITHTQTPRSPCSPHHAEHSEPSAYPL